VENWQAVAGAINARMAELPLTQKELAERSGVSVATLRELQHAKAGRRRSARTLAAISLALGWPDGYLQARLTGGTVPGGSSRAGQEADISIVLTRLDELHGEVRRLADAVDRLADDRKAP
jgi:transcriptional regulator with XRE-family HTH domain